jgi:hypothetical protein
MFTTRKLFILLLIGIGITVAMYYLDTDPPIDSIGKRVAITGFVSLVVFVFYSVFFLVWKVTSYLENKLMK